METITYNGPLDDRYQAVHVALGNFDGVHLGHQKLIGELVREARMHHGTAVVATFDPHPLHVIRPETSPKLLTPTQVKSQLIARLGADIALILPFNSELARLTPEEFAHRVLIEHLRATSVMVGFNYSFGRGGKGTPQLLWDLGRQKGFRVKVIEAITLGGEPVSSTLIRQALEAGKIERATELLGYAPILQGMVVHGDQRGRKIGFPTANLHVAPEQLVPGRGVYTAWARIGSDYTDGYLAVVNIGVKPTFAAGLVETIEAHLNDFDGDIYGQQVTLHLLTRIRPEIRFDEPDQLIQQIQRDVLSARHYISTRREHIFPQRIIEI